MLPVIVHKGRTLKLPVSLGYDVSNDTLESQIREETDRTSPLIAEWTVEFVTDGTDGEIMLILDDSVTAEITKSKGYMDLKRITGGEPVAAFDDILEVHFRETITE